MKINLYLCCWLILFPLFLSAQTYEESINLFQQELNKKYADPNVSPLPNTEIKGFKGLPFFPINENYRVVANFEKLPPTSPYHMKTSDNKLRDYDQFGRISFTLENQNYQLTVYQNTANKLKEGYQNSLFLPFTDESNGVETYGGGRYLDLEIPEGDSIIVDFNKAYHPYCAYSSRYSCPIPPKENDLAIAIHAGVRIAR